MKTISEIESPTLENILYLRFKILKENLLRYNFVNLCDVDNIFFDFRRYNIIKYLPTTLNDYELEFYLGGIDYFTKLWVEKGMQESVEEITKKLLELI
jgi:hypothetical protein